MLKQLDPMNQPPSGLDKAELKLRNRLLRRRYERVAACLRAVMSTPEGRALFWEVLATTGVFTSVMRPPLDIHYLAGKQDLGHELQEDLLEVDADLYQLMERDMRALAKRDALEMDAHRARGHNDVADN